MNRAGTNDYEQSAVLVAALDDLDCLVAALEDGFSRLRCLGDLALQKVGRCEGVVAANAPIL